MKEGSSGNAFFNQLNGKTIYITDFYLNRKNFKAFGELLEKKIKQK